MHPHPGGCCQPLPDSFGAPCDPLTHCNPAVRPRDTSWREQSCACSDRSGRAGVLVGGDQHGQLLSQDNVQVEDCVYEVLLGQMYVVK